MGSDSRSSGSRRVALVALCAACMAWGLSFVFIKDLDRVLFEELGWTPWTAAAWIVTTRFLLAFAILIPWPVVRRGILSRALHRDAFLLAVVSATGYVLQAAGIRGMDPGVNAFLTSLYTPFTPLLGWLLFRLVPRPRILAAVPVAVAGVVLLTGPSGLGFGLDEGLVVLGAVFWALQILLIDRLARRHGTGPFSGAFFLWTGALGLAATIALRSDVPFADLVTTVARPDLVVPIAGLACLATVFTLVVIVRYQPRLDPSRAALLYVLEPVFAATFAVLLRGESMGGFKLAGCLTLLGANVLVEIRRPRRG